MLQNNSFDNGVPELLNILFDETVPIVEKKVEEKQQLFDLMENAKVGSPLLAIYENDRIVRSPYKVKCIIVHHNINTDKWGLIYLMTNDSVMCAYYKKKNTEEYGIETSDIHGWWDANMIDISGVKHLRVRICYNYKGSEGKNSMHIFVMKVEGFCFEGLNVTRIACVSHEEEIYVTDIANKISCTFCTT